MAGAPRDSEPRDETRVREHLANERTLLSWVRLGLSSAGFGFVVARFGLFLRETAAPGTVPTQGRFTEGVGALLILLGPVLVIVAAQRFFKTEREIDAGVYTRRYGLIWSLIVTSVVLGVVLVGYLLFTGR